jgi:protein-S-isoprenylcysteine O-methyltransferase Ste14
MENTYLAPVVRIQRERGQHVISTGPYAIIRHPYYAGAGLLIIATPLMLGSWYGLAASAILAGALVFRIIMEEHELGRNLEGYAEYTRHVQYRLVPLIW